MAGVKFETGKLGIVFHLRGLAIGKPGDALNKRAQVRDCDKLEEALDLAQGWLIEGRHMEVKIYKVEHTMTLSVEPQAEGEGR